jgi:hypothetical protein
MDQSQTLFTHAPAYRFVGLRCPAKAAYRHSVQAAVICLLLVGQVAQATVHETNQQYSELLAIAAVRPCLATALLYVGLGPTHSEAGILRFDGIPTRETVLTLTDTSGIHSADIVTQATPYSDAAYYVEVRWTVSRISRNEYFFTTSGAELVDKKLTPLNPGHIIEPPTTALVTDHSILLLSAPRRQ